MTPFIPCIKMHFGLSDYNWIVPDHMNSRGGQGRTVTTLSASVNALFKAHTTARWVERKATAR